MHLKYRSVYRIMVISLGTHFKASLHNAQQIKFQQTLWQRVGAKEKGDSSGSPGKKWEPVLKAGCWLCIQAPNLIWGRRERSRQQNHINGNFSILGHPSLWFLLSSCPESHSGRSENISVNEIRAAPTHCCSSPLPTSSIRVGSGKGPTCLGQLK